jgi:hypothetical protein
MCFSPCKNEQKKIAATNNDDEKNFLFFYKKVCVCLPVFSPLVRLKNSCEIFD